MGAQTDFGWYTALSPLLLIASPIYCWVDPSADFYRSCGVSPQVYMLQNLPILSLEIKYCMNFGRIFKQVTALSELWAQTFKVADCSVSVSQSFSLFLCLVVYFVFHTTKSIQICTNYSWNSSDYSGIIPNAFHYLPFQKLCWYNRHQGGRTGSHVDVICCVTLKNISCELNGFCRKIDWINRQR